MLEVLRERACEVENRSCEIDTAQETSPDLVESGSLRSISPQALKLNNSYHPQRGNKEYIMALDSVLF